MLVWWQITPALGAWQRGPFRLRDPWCWYRRADGAIVVFGF